MRPHSLKGVIRCFLPLRQKKAEILMKRSFKRPISQREAYRRKKKRKSKIKRILQEIYRKLVRASSVAVKTWFRSIAVRILLLDLVSSVRI